MRIVAEGDRENLDEIFEIMKKGTPAAQVAEVRVEFVEATNEYSKFEITY